MLKIWFKTYSTQQSNLLDSLFLSPHSPSISPGCRDCGVEWCPHQRHDGHGLHRAAKEGAQGQHCEESGYEQVQANADEFTEVDTQCHCRISALKKRKQMYLQSSYSTNK